MSTYVEVVIILRFPLYRGHVLKNLGRSGLKTEGDC